MFQNDGSIVPIVLRLTGDVMFPTGRKTLGWFRARSYNREPSGTLGFLSSPWVHSTPLGIPGGRSSSSQFNSPSVLAFGLLTRLAASVCRGLWAPRDSIAARPL